MNTYVRTHPRTHACTRTHTYTHASAIPKPHNRDDNDQIIIIIIKTDGAREPDLLAEDTLWRQLSRPATDDPIHLSRQPPLRLADQR